MLAEPEPLKRLAGVDEAGAGKGASGPEPKQVVGADRTTKIVHRAVPDRASKAATRGDLAGDEQVAAAEVDSFGGRVVASTADGQVGVKRPTGAQGVLAEGRLVGAGCQNTAQDDRCQAAD